MTSADYTSHGAVAVIRLDNPPVNAPPFNARSASVRRRIEAVRGRLEAV
jgi:hypothetical protein